jgi:predicted DNA-binding transcriptional regulator YafY
MKSLLSRITKLDHFIHHRTTGAPSALGQKLGVSERTVFDYLKLMKEMGAPIQYSRDQATYYYQGDGRFNVRFIEDNQLDWSSAENQTGELHQDN